jgi:hypothetical protein
VARRHLRRARLHLRRPASPPLPPASSPPAPRRSRRRASRMPHGAGNPVPSGQRRSLSRRGSWWSFAGVTGMACKVRGSNPLSSTPGQRPIQDRTRPEPHLSRGRFAATDERDLSSLSQQDVLQHPLIIVTFRYGLSIDYEVFILVRRREAHDRTGSATTAITASRCVLVSRAASTVPALCTLTPLDPQGLPGASTTYHPNEENLC